MLWGVAQAQTIGYLRYDTVKIFTNKVGGRGSLDVTGNVKFTGLLPKSAGTDSVIVRDANGNLGTTAKSAFGGSQTWQQTLVTGSTLNQNNTVLMGTNTLEFNSNGGGVFSSDIRDGTNDTSARLALTGGSSALGQFDVALGDWFNAVTFSPTNILFNSHNSDFIIDSLKYGLGTKAVRYNPATGFVTYADTTSGGSGSGVTTMAAIGASPNANGATISGSTLNLEPASASFGGVITTGTQTFAGVKTFPTPVFTTSAQTPLLIGGTAANDDITINGTSNGTKTSSYVNLQPSGGLVGIGTSSPGFLLDVRGATTEEFINIQGSGTGSIKIGTVGGSGEFGAMWAAQASPSVSNYAFLGNASFSIFNVPSGGSINFRVNNADQMVISSAGGLRLNAYGAGTLTTDGSGNISATSDLRTKHHIKDFKLGLNGIMRVNPSTFIRNADSTNSTEVGFIAQNIQKAFGGLGVGQQPDGMLTLNTNVILAAAVNAIQEQQREIDKLKNEIKKLKKK